MTVERIYQEIVSQRESLIEIRARLSALEAKFESRAGWLKLPPRQEKP